MCHVSRVMCHLSPVMCHLSHVQKKFSNFNTKKKHFIKIGQKDGASRWRVCYQRGLPRLVYQTFIIQIVKIAVTSINDVSL